MARLFFDLLIVAALSKEILDLARAHVLSQGLFLTVALLFPFFLGMAPGESGLTSIVRYPIRNFVRTGIALVSFLFYLEIQLLTGALWQFGVLYAVSIVTYLLGRAAGLALRALWFALGIGLAIWLYLLLINR